MSTTTQITNVNPYTCPFCGSKDLAHGMTDVRGSAKPEWVQEVTCNTCFKPFRSVFQHSYHEVEVDFKEAQETAKKELLGRIQANALTDTDLRLFSDMLSNSEFVPECGFGFGIYALA